MHNQPPKSPNPPSPPYQGGNRYQGDLENFATVGVIGKRLLIYLIHHNKFYIHNQITKVCDIEAPKVKTK